MERLCAWAGALGALGSAGKRASARLYLRNGRCETIQHYLWRLSSLSAFTVLGCYRYPNGIISFKPFLSKPQLVVQGEEDQLFQMPLLYHHLPFNVFSSGVQLYEMAKSHRIEPAKRQQRDSVFTLRPVSPF